MTPEQQKILIDLACEARARAHAPYSHFKVGAALLGDDDRTFAGCNVENASYGLSMCAERVAVGNSLAGGCRNWLAITIATSGGTVPCGACRQVLAEFSPDLSVLLIDVDKEQKGQEPDIRITSLSELFPDPFAL